MTFDKNRPLMTIKFMLFSTDDACRNIIVKKPVSNRAMKNRIIRRSLMRGPVECCVILSPTVCPSIWDL